ncbi:MAG: aminotransferase class V-fold PLP-dependent enzyme, partial [Anaerolineae bacterium]
MAQEIIYLDHAATTPVDPRVVEAMLPYWTEQYGNPSSIYSLGRAAARALESAREKVASILHCEPREVIFTSCGTESDN